MTSNEKEGDANQIEPISIDTLVNQNEINHQSELIIEHEPLLITRQFFNSFSSLIKLVLNDCSLHKMPRSILKLENLNYLDLSNNCIDVIPIEIGKLTKLQTLKYENNKCRPLTDFINIDRFKNLIEISQFVINRQSISHPIRAFLPYNESDTFKIMSYNILSAKFNNQVAYPFCLKEYLPFERRFPIILNEIKHYKPHIICLQEVQYGLFHSVFKPEIEALGYNSFYAPKGMFAKAKEADKPFVLGQATFVANETETNLEIEVDLSLVTTLEFKTSPYLRQGNCPKRTKKYSETALIVPVRIHKKGGLNPEESDNDYKISIVNTHLQWKPTCDDVRADQLKIAVLHAIELAKKGNDESFSYDIIVSGDFNSYPDTQAIAFMNNHPENFVSAYDAMNQPFYLTHLTCDFDGLLDYIYTTQNRLEVASVLPLYPDNIVHEMALEWPDNFHPSDHLPIIAALKLK